MIGPAFIALTTGPNTGQARPCIVTNETADGLVSVNVAVAKSDLISNTGWLVLDKVRKLAIAATPEEAVERWKKLVQIIKSETESAHRAAVKEAESATAAVEKAQKQIEAAKAREQKAIEEAAKAAQEAAALKKKESEERKRADEAAKTVKELQPA